MIRRDAFLLDQGLFKRRRGISKVMIVVWAGNETAYRFYERCGFMLTLNREHHGLPMNVYVFDVSDE